MRIIHTKERSKVSRFMRRVTNTRINTMCQVLTYIPIEKSRKESNIWFEYIYITFTYGENSLSDMEISGHKESQNIIQFSNVHKRQDNTWTCVSICMYVQLNMSLWKMGKCLVPSARKNSPGLCLEIHPAHYQNNWHYAQQNWKEDENSLEVTLVTKVMEEELMEWVAEIIMTLRLMWIKKGEVGIC